MNRLAKYLLVFVIVFHVAAFAVEAVFWMQPAVHETVLARLAAGSPVSLRDQAAILRTLFLNQGFYNLFLALGGVAALAMVSQGRLETGRTLALYVCLVAVGAGVVLALSTGTFAGAALQAVPAAVAAALLIRQDP